MRTQEECNQLIKEWLNANDIGSDKATILEGHPIYLSTLTEADGLVKGEISFFHSELRTVPMKVAPNREVRAAVQQLYGDNGFVGSSYTKDEHEDS